MEVTTVGGSGSFYYFHQLQLPRPHSVEASTSFHIPLRTPTYFHECHKLPVAALSLPEESTDFHDFFELKFRGRLNFL